MGMPSTVMRYLSAGVSFDQSPCAKNIELRSVTDRRAMDCRQYGFHLDGNGDGHRQTARGVVLERCCAVLCGQRSCILSAELRRSNFYFQSGRHVDCHPAFCRKAGFLCKNEESGALVLDRCCDTGSVYGLVIEYSGNGRIDFADVVWLFNNL